MEAAHVDQATVLLDMGYTVRNTFVEPLSGEKPDERAKSDPTSSSSSRSSSVDADRRMDEFRGMRSRMLPRPDGAQPQERPAHAPREVRNSASEAEGADLHRPAVVEDRPALVDVGNLRQRAAAKGMDLDDVLVQVPFDDRGEPTSIGSALHYSGTCKPCVFSASARCLDSGAAPCADGVLCRFCHFPHENVKKVRIRPAKAKRDRLNKILTKLVDSYDQDPGEKDQDVHVEEEDIPEWIKKKPLMFDQLKSSVRGRVASLKQARVDDQDRARSEAHLCDGLASSFSASSSFSGSAAIPLSGGLPFSGCGADARVFRISL